MSAEVSVIAVDVSDGREEEKSSGQQESPVMVTGFGPFHHHTVNASWVAVQEMSKLGVQHNSKSVPLRIAEIPVAYEVVSSEIPRLHREIQPRLCVHVGVSPYEVVKLEKYGRNVGYRGPDIYGKTPQTQMCVPGGPDSIPTQFNIDGVCKTLLGNQCEVTFETSNDAGRYLCDFIYYTSLHHSRVPVVFVHVPELDRPYSAQQLGVALKNLIETLLNEFPQ